MACEQSDAPGRPGRPARWTSSAKAGVGTAVTDQSRVWFTLGRGILSEVFYDSIDSACTRDMELIVTDGREFLSAEKRDAGHEIRCIAPGVPAYELVNTCGQGRYRIHKTVVADPRRDVVLQQVRFEALKGAPAGYHLYVLLAPHLRNRGGGNTGWTDDYKGLPMLLAAREGTCLALACSAPWLRRSAGFVGVSDGWEDLRQHRRMEWAWRCAADGNVTLAGQVDLQPGHGECVLALGFGHTPAEAAQNALASLQDGFGASLDEYVRGWQSYQRRLAVPPEAARGGPDLYRASMAVLQCHESKRYPGGSIASLSIPWGSARGDNDQGGYHVAWIRDMVQVAGAYLAAGIHERVFRSLHYLQATQEQDGHWLQNMWLDGTVYWTGAEIDETASPILLVDLARRHLAIGADEIGRLWPMVRRAAAYLVARGPGMQLDRWESAPGYSPYSMAVEVAALLAAADLAELQAEPDLAAYLRETADSWNELIDRLTYARDTPLARRFGVAGYYVRTAPPETTESQDLQRAQVRLANRPSGQDRALAADIVSPDALALVRYGLRSADDPRIVDTIRVIDGTLKVDLPGGPAWRRFSHDGYGEHEDGRPFDGTGVGRAWPLLTGERGHYELAAGRRGAARRLLEAMANLAGQGGMLPEQVWDAPDIPQRQLHFGGPTGSAMPLAWAHAEYVKLCRSIAEGRIFDQPPQPMRRYLLQPAGARCALWRPDLQLQWIPAGKVLRIELPGPSAVRWGTDRAAGWHELPTREPVAAVHVVDLPTEPLTAGANVRFTIRSPAAGRLEDHGFQVRID